MSRGKEFTQPVTCVRKRRRTSDTVLETSQDTLAYVKKVMSQPRKAKSAREKASGKLLPTPRVYGRVRWR